MGRVTLQTIADRVGVSRMTVSNAFSKPDQLSADLREQILAVAEELGYVGPDPTARALVSGTAGAVGLVLSDTLRYALSDQVAVTLLGAIADELEPTGLALTLLSAGEQSGFVPARDVALDGALLYSCDPHSSAAEWLLRRRLPLVLVDQAPASGLTSVNVADRSGAAAAARHLLELGHRRIALVTWGVAGQYGVLEDPLRTTVAYTERQRLLGWLEGLRTAGVQPLVVRHPHDDPFAIGQSAAKTILAQRPRPTAVLCFSDAIARGVLAGLHGAGVRVPEDMSVVGFDDNPLAQLTEPALTTVRQDVNAKGRAAVSALLAEMRRPDGEPGPRRRHLVLPTELVIRESTAPLR